MTSDEKMIAAVLKEGYAPENCPMKQKSKKGKCRKCRLLKKCDAAYTEKDEAGRLKLLAALRRAAAESPETAPQGEIVDAEIPPEAAAEETPSPAPAGADIPTPGEAKIDAPPPAASEPTERRSLSPFGWWRK